MNKKLFYGIVMFTVICAFIIIGWSGFKDMGQNEGKVSTLKFPETLASLPRTELISGEEAIQQIARLHGKEISLQEGYVVQYKADSKEITLWVSVSPTSEEGEALFRIMDEKMPNSKIFSNREIMKIDNDDVVKVTGMGQEHFYWVNGNNNYWVAINGLEGIPVVEEIKSKLE